MLPITLFNRKIRIYILFIIFNARSNYEGEKSKLTSSNSVKTAFITIRKKFLLFFLNFRTK